MSDFENEITRIVEEFVVQITEIARRAARSTLESMFGDDADRGAVNSAHAAPAPSARAAASAPRSGRGVKRAPEDIEALAQQFTAFVKANPGLRIEQINKQLGTSTKDLALPIRKLESEGLISTKGQRRATQYFPGKKAK